MGCYYIYKGKQYQELDNLYPILLGEMEEQASVVKVENGKETTVKINTELFPDKRDNFPPFPAKGSSSKVVKSGVEEVFQENPELASIGTQQQYSAYLDTIFPDSKVKDIVYHGSSEKFENFKDEKLGTSTKAKDTDRGHAFSNSKEVAKTYGNNIYSSILNTKNIVEVSPISGESSEFKNEYTSLKEDIDSLEKNLKYNTLITDSKDLPWEYSSDSKKIKRILNIKKEGLNFIAYLDGKKIKELTKEEALKAWNT